MNDMKELVEALIVSNYKNVAFSKWYYPVNPENMDLLVNYQIESLISNNATIGINYRFKKWDADQCMDMMSTNFKDRVVHFKKNDELRLQTNNPAKHILLTKCDRYSKAWGILCQVIPSDLHETGFVAVWPGWNDNDPDADREPIRNYDEWDDWYDSNSYHSLFS